ncbi:hypothetical protein DPEC_G00137230 [Dallia pectoralis]|uniref:Uncharacterized protein n=1 Tax=Dallia pectoralis TaxID=75939 RepID=A0ACC2GLW3_DALPE|nr:hypothetical protein DPEC_G00137230 [Dallia pectoralis]
MATSRHTQAPPIVSSSRATHSLATSPAPTTTARKQYGLRRPTHRSTLPPQFAGGEDNYEDESEEVTEKPVTLCDFDPCLHMQRPCPEVRESKGQSCRCPGLTLPSVTPDPVVALEVWRMWPEAVSVRWCAPYSFVSEFGVWALGNDGGVLTNTSVSSWSRQASVFGLEPGRRYDVCVRAANRAGTSRRRCVSVSLPVAAETAALYVLAGLCSALVMVVIVMCACLHCHRKKGSGSGTRALYDVQKHTLRAPRLTRLVSIPNPAYRHSDVRVVPLTAHARHTNKDQLTSSNNIR